ncbi:energy transducer TonB [Myroides odoratus]|uniref:energy transducer TonB n=1 Tax=Myroides odoratus TaxID=256 RepID=UPI000765E255|nr:energy transducer TonB [Myroides odoratus]
MKIHLTIFLFCIALGRTSAQTLVPTNTQKEQVQDDNDIYTFVDTPAEYPGGISAFNKAFIANFEPPKIDPSVRKLVFVVQFVIEKNGHVSQISVLKDFGYDIEQNVRTAFEKLETWKPALIKEKPVRFKMTLPITAYPQIEEVSN